MADPINLNPVTIGTEQMSQINQLFADERGGAEPILAEQLTSEVAVDYPELITYQGLRDGTAPLFNQLPQFADLAPEDRGLSNAQIISLFAVDEQGDPIQEGTFAGGVKREILPSIFSMSGAYTGARIGGALQQPIPPAGPWGVAVKLAIPTVTTIIGGFGGYEAGEATADQLFGPEKPVTPGSIAAYESGKTFGGAIGWLPMPYMISKNVNFGAAQYLTNLAEGQKGPLSTRLIAGAEKLLSKSGTAARSAPISTAIIETTAGAGAAGGAYTAETVDPGDASTRLGLEVTGGLGGAIIANRLTSLVPALKSVKEGAGKLVRGEFQIKGRRQQAAANRILDILEESGEDVDAIIERLGSKEFDDILIDPDTGKPITLTAGMKADSPALMAIEAALAQTSPGLGKERSAKNVQANNALRNTIAALVATGNPEALQVAAQLAEDVFSAGLNNRMQRAAANVIAASQRVGGTDPASNIALSQKLFDLASTQLSQARSQEKKLWGAVDDVDITVFRDADGNEVALPNFLTAWEKSMPKTEEAAAEINKKLAPLSRFIDRKRGELGLDGDGVDLPPMTEEFQARFDSIRAALKDVPADQRDAFIKTEQDKLLRTTPETEEGKFFANLEGLRGADLDAPDLPPLTTTEATEMRQLALNLSRQLTATGDYNAARIASNFADGLLDDLNYSIPEGENVAYDIARAYSKSLNDTFTRAFAGRALEKGKTGAERISPELLAQRLMTGGSDPTYLRVKEINDIGQFAIDNGFEGAENIAASIRGTQEMIIRNARAAAFDPQTGEINIKSLQKWMNANSELLDTYPALRADLNNAARANTVLQGRNAQNKSAQAAMRGQITFQNLLPSNTESPTFAVARALASGQKAPVRSLNNLLDVAQNAPEEIRADAMSGLKHSILEWAMTKGGATSRSFSPRSMYDNLYSKIPNANSNISTMDWMISNGVIEEKQANQLKKYLTEMVRLEVMDSQGTLGDIAEGAGPMLDFYLRITGSAVGTRMQALLPGGGGAGSLVAASAGSKAMRNIFDKVPESMKMDVMSEMMENPELLAAMMRKPRNDKEKLRVAGVVGTVLEKLGFTSAPVSTTRRAAPQILSDDEVEPIEVEQETIEESSVRLPVPTVPTQPVAQPTTAVASATPRVAPPPPPAQTGTVDRARFAAMFPEDRDLIQGIGSLMG
jgi:hypothetical protein